MNNSNIDTKLYDDEVLKRAAEVISDRQEEGNNEWLVEALDSVWQGCVDKFIEATTLALLEERKLYRFIAKAMHMDKPLTDVIWQEIDKPGSVLGEDSLSAHSLLKLWFVMESEFEINYGEIYDEPGEVESMLDMLCAKIEEESELGYLCAEEAFLHCMDGLYPACCNRSEADIWMERCLELSRAKENLGKNQAVDVTS